MFRAKMKVDLEKKHKTLITKFSKVRFQHLRMLKYNLKEIVLPFPD